jgi:hypothetical protein
MVIMVGLLSIVIPVSLLYYLGPIWGIVSALLAVLIYFAFAPPGPKSGFRPQWLTQLTFMVFIVNFAVFVMCILELL